MYPSDRIKERELMTNIEHGVHGFRAEVAKAFNLEESDDRIPLICELVWLFILGEQQ